jgi:hypothetical protein
MGFRLSLPIAALAVVWSCAGGPVLAQPLEQAFLAASSEADAKVDAIRGDRSPDTPTTTDAVMQAAHRPVDKPDDITRDPSFFSRWLLSVVARDATPDGIEDAWRARKAAVAGVIRTLTPESRAEIAAALDSLLRTMPAYAFDRGHIRQAFTDCRETLASYEKKGGLYARSASEAEQDFAERMKRLGLERNGLALANDLWVAGGHPLLRTAVRVGGELRRELATEAPAVDRAADAAR